MGEHRPLGLTAAAFRAALERAAQAPVKVADGQLVLDLPAAASQISAVHALLVGRDGWQIASAPDGSARVTIDIQDPA